MEEFLLRVFRAIDFDHCDAIWWRTDGEYAPVTIFVNCNDLFYWATADAERLTPENIAEFEKALADMEKIGERFRGPELFCARVRKMRPQPPCYRGWTPEVAALFDACGPARDPKECG